MWRGALVSDGTAEPNLSWALRCLYATESEWTNAGGSCDGFRLGGGQTEKKASLGLKMACEHRLQEMETTYNQDQGLLKEKKARELERCDRRFCIACGRRRFYLTR